MIPTKLQITFTHYYNTLPDPDGVSTKAATDAMVLFGLVEDDSDEYMLTPRHKFCKVPKENESTDVLIHRVDMNSVQEGIGMAEDPSDPFGTGGYSLENGVQWAHWTRRWRAEKVMFFSLPVVLPTWNKILNTKPMQRKTQRQYVHAMMMLGMSGLFGFDDKRGKPPPQYFDWPLIDCPWSYHRREWNHFIERYYRGVLGRYNQKTKVINVPESKYWKP